MDLAALTYLPFQNMSRAFRDRPVLSRPPARFRLAQRRDLSEILRSTLGSLTTAAAPEGNGSAVLHRPNIISGASGGLVSECDQICDQLHFFRNQLVNLGFVAASNLNGLMGK